MSASPARLTLSPDTTRWFNDEEKKLAIYRIASQNFAEGTSAVNMEMTMLQALKAAVVDPATCVRPKAFPSKRNTDESSWLILFTQTGLTSASTFSNFFPTIIASGFRPFQNPLSMMY